MEAIAKADGKMHTKVKQFDERKQVKIRMLYSGKLK